MLEAKKDSVLQEDLEIIAFSNVDWNLLDGSTILVTGATGLIGSQIIKALACRNRICNASIKILACVRNMEKATSALLPFPPITAIPAPPWASWTA